MKCALSIAWVMVAKGVDSSVLAPHVPSVNPESIEFLLPTLSGSMLVIATFAVGSTVASYASAGRTAPATWSRR